MNSIAGSTARSFQAFHLDKAGPAPLRRLGNAARLEELLSIRRKQEFFAAFPANQNLAVNSFNHKSDAAPFRTL